MQPKNLFGGPGRPGTLHQTASSALESAPLSLDLRRRIVEAYANGEGSYETLATRFRVGIASVNRYISRARRTGKVDPDPHGGGNPARIDPSQAGALAELVGSMPDATAEELAGARRARHRAKISRSSMLRALHRFGLSFKKSPSAQRSNSKTTFRGSARRSAKS